jgi:hypothetical protein
VPRRAALLLLACASLTATVVAAPVPPQADLTAIERAYGAWSDPDKDCNFKLTGGELKVSIPTSDHMLGKPLEGVTNNAPRALREVDGDFTAVVRVVIPVPDKLPMRAWPFCSGGLVAWESDQKHFGVWLCGGGVNGIREAIWGFHRTATEQRSMIVGLGAPTGKAFVRLKREGQKVTAGWSRDGKQWKEDPQDVAWGAKVKVGVVAENNLGVPVEVTFDQYSLTQPKK